MARTGTGPVTGSKSSSAIPTVCRRLRYAIPFCSATVAASSVAAIVVEFFEGFSMRDAWWRMPLLSVLLTAPGCQSGDTAGGNPPGGNGDGAVGSADWTQR